MMSSSGHFFQTYKNGGEVRCLQDLITILAQNAEDLCCASAEAEEVRKGTIIPCNNQQ